LDIDSSFEHLAFGIVAMDALAQNRYHAPMRPSYPLLLDVSTRLCVIVGGGEVAARKARGLIDAGATWVRVVAPEVKFAFPDSVQILREKFEARHLDGAGLVFAATDDEKVNDAVAAAAKERNILMNRADQDDDAASDFLTPAKMQQGDVILTFTAISPALAVHIRSQVEKIFRPGWAQMASFFQEIRPQLINSNLPIERRRGIFRELATEEAISLLESRGLDALRQWLYDRYPEAGAGCHRWGTDEHR
jgi:precorrin-2 dehydrogenase/sirohydrochlorin ferrochelatase